MFTCRSAAITVMITAKQVMLTVKVPMKRPTFFLCPAPMYWEIMIVPALVKPMARKVSRLFRSPPIDTAERPALPMTFPTMIISTML